MRSVFILTVICPGLAFAQPSLWQGNSQIKAKAEIIELEVTPAPLPSPLLKYRFWPSAAEMHDSDASLLIATSVAQYQSVYHRHSATDDQPPKDENLRLAIDRLLRATEWQQEDVQLAQRIVQLTETEVLNPLARAALFDDADWGHWKIFREQHWTEAYQTLLPIQQESRWLGRLLSLKARLAARNGDIATAVNTLRTQFRLGHHIADSPFLVSRLVGAAICFQAANEILRLSEHTASANLYFALATLPNSPITMRPSVEAEWAVVEGAIGWPDDEQFGLLTESEWRDIFIDQAEDLIKFGGRNQLNLPEPVKSDPILRRAAAGIQTSLRAILQYPRAKQLLIDDGASPAEVDNMPVGEVIARIQHSTTQRVLQRSLSHLYLPPHERPRTNAQWNDDIDSPDAFITVPPVVRLLRPVISNVNVSEVRLSGQIAALKTIEALRAHAAETGSWPTSLADIEVVPIPVNPWTGQPFEYRLENDIAILEAAFTLRPQLNKVYRLRLIDTGKESN